MLECIFTIIMFLLCIILFLVAKQYPSAPISAGGGASFYPKFLIGVLFFLMILYAIKNRDKIMKAWMRSSKSAIERMFSAYKGTLLFLAILVTIPALFPLAGFIVTGWWAVFTSSLAIRWKEGMLSIKSIATSFVLGIVASVAVYLIFTYVFVIPLPKGSLL